MQHSSSNPYLPSMAKRFSEDASASRTTEHEQQHRGGSLTSPSSANVSPSLALPSTAGGSPALVPGGGGGGNSALHSQGSPGIARTASSAASSPSRPSPYPVSSGLAGSSGSAGSAGHSSSSGLYGGAGPNLPSDFHLSPANANARQMAMPNHAGSSRHASPMMSHPNLSSDSFPNINGALPRPLSRNLSRGSAFPQHHQQQGQQSGHEARTQLFVGNLPFRVRWQDLKDLFRKCGTVLRSDVALTLDNRSKGFGTVLFATEIDAHKAIEMYNGYTWQSRVLDVRLDAQDPHGNVAMANAAAQQAQQAAHLSHQQAMQNMANIIGMNAAQAAMAAMQQQQQGGLHPHQFHQHQQQQHLHPHQQHQFHPHHQPQHLAPFGPGGNGLSAPPSPWMAAALAANVNAATTAALMQQQQHQASRQQNHLSAGIPNHDVRRASFDSQSQHSAQSLLTPMANMHLQHSHPHLQEGSGTSALASTTPLVSPSISSSSRPGTSGGQPSSTAASSSAPDVSSPSGPSATATAPSSAASPPPTGSASPKESVSPTSARRPPPGTLGSLPPSIFANMSTNAHLPNPPAAEAAAKAAGYSLEDEANDASAISPSGSLGHASQQPQQPQQPQQQASPHVPSRTGTPSRGHGDVDAAAHTHGASHQQGVPGGLVNFYNHGNGSSSSMGVHGQPPGHYAGSDAGYGGAPQPPMYMRSSSSPAYANRHLFIGNIPFNCQWQDLKDLFRSAGQILRADVSLGPDGRSRGFGTVLFQTTEDAMNAVQMFNGYEYQGRTLKVHFDKFSLNQQQQPGGGSSFGAAGPGQFMMGVPGRGASYQGHSPLPQQRQLHPSQMQQQYQAGGPAHTHFGPSHTQIPPPQAPTSMGVHPGFQPSQGLGGFVPGHRHAYSFDDNSSVPGTPIHELSLQMAAGFPSPGFGSPIPQFPRQSSDQRRAGFNSEGIAVAPIGSGAPHHAGEDALQYQQQQQQSGQAQGHGPPPPLSPLSIPPRTMGGGMGMGIPSPGPGGMFSPMGNGMGPMSPHQGMPLMTPSMPGFSFHPFPQTPPLLPQFLSPGLGPFSPPLAGTNNFFGPSAPSGLRNAAPGGGEQEYAGDDATPLQSPDLALSQRFQYRHQQHPQEQYFPMMMAPQPITGQRHVRSDSHRSVDTASEDRPMPDSTVQASAVSGMAPASTDSEQDEPGTPTQAEVGGGSSEPPTTGGNGEARSGQVESAPGLNEDGDGDAATPEAEINSGNGMAIRRASFRDIKTGSGSLAAPSDAAMQRGTSLDIPRPVMDLTSPDKTTTHNGALDGSHARNGSGSSSSSAVVVEADGAVADEQKEQKKKSPSKDEAKSAPAMGVKRGPWTLPWLKK